MGLRATPRRSGGAAGPRNRRSGGHEQPGNYLLTGSRRQARSYSGLSVDAKAAENGYAAAQNDLALMYANGQAIRRDYVWAYAWFDIASDQLSQCNRMRDEFGKAMMPDDIARARICAATKRDDISKRAMKAE